MEERFRDQLEQRAAEGTLRSLRHRRGAVDDQARNSSDRNISSPSTSPPAIDFASNDYLGLARCPHQLQRVEKAFASHVPKLIASASPLLGSTGSRLLSGDTSFAASLEVDLAKAHNRPAALLFNSGYDANLSVLGCSLMPGDFVVMDDLCHNSLIMGVRMSRLGWEGGGDSSGNVRMFRHNDVDSLVKVLDGIANPSGNGPLLGKDSKILIVVESVYSMDGDVAPLEQILNIASSRRGASVVVDEAHGLGVYGTTNADDLCLENVGTSRERSHTSSSTGGGTGVLAALNLERHPSLLCSVHTFGKAAGCHGAVVAASKTTVSYLINYARPFVYSTSPPPHALATIRCAYEAMMGPVGEERRQKVFRLVRLFRLSLDDKAKQKAGLRTTLDGKSLLLPSPSPIQAVLIPGNRQCIELCSRLHSSNFDVYPIRSPTVPKGQERVRIIIHSHNTEEEIEGLVDVLTCEILALARQSKL